MVLFFDVYIVDDFYTSKNLDNQRLKDEWFIRSNSNSYRFRSKLEITKYTLTSYSVLDWESVYIRFECENNNEVSDFESFCFSIFPNAFVENKRSDSAIKYVEALKKINNLNNPWVFFSPNNDHPYIGLDKSLEKYTNIASTYEKLYNNHVVSICYSHFTENMNSVKPSKHLWGEYKNIFLKILFENKDYYVVKVNKFACDSIHIIRLDTLLKIFNETKNKGRVIRQENTEFYLCKNIKHIIVLPKLELCRHYDGYFHRYCWGNMKNAPPPLFIPDNFFEKNMKIRYGYDDYKDNFININPNSLFLNYLNPNAPDLNISINKVPLMWKSRIKEIDINPNFLQNENYLISEKLLINPWLQHSYYQIIGLILKRFLKILKNVFIHEPIFNLKHFLYIKFRNTKFYTLYKSI
jgi:hypothetical protein